MWLVLLAASVRLLALWDDGDSLLYQVGGLDAPQYLDMGRRFTTGEWPDEKPFFWAPGYSVFLGLLMSVSASVTWLKLAQVALGTASCVLVGLLASRLFQDRRVAIVAVAGAALYGPLVYYDLQIAPASLDVFLHLLSLVLLLEARSRNAVWLWLAAGVIAAASAVTRGAVLLLLPFAAAWLLWPPPRLTGRVLLSHALALVALLAPVGLVLALVSQHNIEGDRTWGDTKRPFASASEGNAFGGLFLSYNFGINLLLGNVPEMHAINRVEHPQCLLNYKMLVFKPVLEGASKPSAQSSFLAEEALSWMRSHPLEWLRLQGQKALELVHGEEISRDTSIEASGVENRVLDLLLWKHGIAFPSGLLIPLALLGIAFAPKRSRAHALVLGALAAQALFVLAFFVTTRYRLALWIAAMPYAAYAAIAAFDAVRAQRMSKNLVMVALLAVAMFAVSNYGVSPEPVAHAAFEHDHLGALLDREGKQQEAVEQWKTALSIDPRYAQAHFQLANYSAKHSDLSAAATHYDAGLQAAPTAFAARIAYADILIKQARPSEATDQLRRVLQQVSSARVRMSACGMAKRAKLDLRPDC
jgi:4-amino-4-deoxy-L-arabinose transferase-like glycosyltransferase